MNAKTTATRAKRSHRVADTFVKRIYARAHRDALEAQSLALANQVRLMEWMDRTPAERRREVNRLYRECRRNTVAWRKASDKCERLGAK